MKIAIFIMSAEMQPAQRNVEAFKDTVAKYTNENKDRLKHKYTFIVYLSNPSKSVNDAHHDKLYDNLFYVYAPYAESVYRTFEKTHYVLEKFGDSFDMYVRVNISMYLNIDLLDSVIDKLKPHNVYCNAINSHVNLNSKYCNDIYPRGDLMIFDRYIRDIIVKEGEKFLFCDIKMKDRLDVDHVDDCLIGICLIDGIGKDYYQHLYMLKYNYIPDANIPDDSKINRYAIGSRIKTVPPEIGYSGYSWDDNDYRLYDVKKFHQLYDFYNRNPMKYEGVKMPDVLVDKNASRPTLFVVAENRNVHEVFWKYLEQKRK